MVRRLSVLILAGSLLAGPSAQAATYAVDKDHTTVGFKIRHVFSYVTGSFDQFEGTITYAPGQPASWAVEALAQAASVNTKNEKRDQHLRSAEFFNVDQFPVLSFKSTQVTEATATSAKLHGLLSIHGVEKPVVFDLQVHGVGKDPWGNVRAGFTATTRINRKDFGLNWNQALETGGVLVGEEVDIILEIEGIKQ
jgi:polyisoprenoid-binding protein YceI